MTPQNPYMVSLAGLGQEEESKSSWLTACLAHMNRRAIDASKWTDMASPDPVIQMFLN